MATFFLSNGREISLKRLAVGGTYSGCLEGSIESNSARIVKRIGSTAASLLGPATPLMVIPPTTTPLPQWFVVAEFESKSGVRTTDPDFYSFLYVCWFVENIDQNIPALIKSVLLEIDWERVAEDYDYTVM